MNTYTIRVRDANSWNNYTGKHSILAECEHKHKSTKTAQKCLDRLTEWRCLCGKTTQSIARCCGAPRHHTSAYWYNATIEKTIED